MTPIKPKEKKAKREKRGDESKDMKRNTGIKT